LSGFGLVLCVVWIGGVQKKFFRYVKSMLALELVLSSLIGSWQLLLAALDCLSAIVVNPVRLHNGLDGLQCQLSTSLNYSDVHLSRHDLH
jgi:hypothetical protein